MAAPGVYHGPTGSDRRGGAGRLPPRQAGRTQQVPPAGEAIPSRIALDANEYGDYYWHFWRFVIIIALFINLMVAKNRNEIKIKTTKDLQQNIKFRTHL